MKASPEVLQGPIERIAVRRDGYEVLFVMAGEKRIRKCLTAPVTGVDWDVISLTKPGDQVTVKISNPEEDPRIVQWTVAGLN